MAVSELASFDWLPLQHVKRVFLGAHVPAALVRTVKATWPGLIVFAEDADRTRIPKCDLIVCTEDDLDEPAAADQARRGGVKLVIGDFAAARHFGADACIPQRCRPSDFLTQIAFLDGIAARKIAEAQKTQGILTKLHTLQQKFDALDQSLADAERLQADLSSKQTQSWENGALTFRIWPKNAIGGDLMGSFNAGPDHIGFFSIDVVGHGIASSLFCARIAGLFTGDTANSNIALTSKRGAASPRDPAQVMENLNALMFDHFETDFYFTACLGFIHRAHNMVTLCQAGQTHPILFGKNTQAQSLPWNGLPVGLVPGADFENRRLVARPGDRLMIYSDGISECQNHRGDQYGDGPLAEFLQNSQGQGAEDVLRQLHQDAKRHGSLTDDACAMVIDFTGPRNPATLGNPLD